MKNFHEIPLIPRVLSVVALTAGALSLSSCADESIRQYGELTKQAIATCEKDVAAELENKQFAVADAQIRAEEYCSNPDNYSPVTGK